MFPSMAGTRAFLLIVAAVGTIGCDLVTKQAASAYLAGTADRSFLSDTIRVGYVENFGGFLSLGADLPPMAKEAVFTVATGTALLALLGSPSNTSTWGPRSLDLCSLLRMAPRIGSTAFFEAVSWTS
jgi:hypothetical protein